MRPFPQNFLSAVAHRYTLTPKQEEAFVALFSGHQTEQAVAESFCIAPSTLRSRMSGVYSKFSLSGDGPGKFNQLHIWLNQEYRKLSKPEEQFAEGDRDDIDALVQRLRKAGRADIKQRCGTMRVLDMEQPIELTGDRGIYTSVNILEKISGRRRLGIAELFQGCGLEELDRVSLGGIAEKRVPGLEAVQRHDKLMVLGKPGAGKTTLMKFLAMSCSEGQFLPDHVPIFVTLKDIEEYALKLEEDE